MRDLWTAVKAAAGAIVSAYVGLHVMIQLIFWAVLWDIATGLAAAFVTRTVSSDASARGITKKALMLLLVAGGEIVDAHTGFSMTLPFGGQLGLGEALAGYYCVHEAVSIVENISRAGVPLPRWLTDRLAKLRQEVDQ
jgi:toxin secretion/phage lysis holin